MSLRSRLCLALALCLATPACAVLEMRFQRTPPPEAFAQVTPGQTDRSQVLALLGPPEEFRRPGVGESARFSTPWQAKIVEGGDVFRRDVYTYATELRRDRRAGILPFFIAIFRVTRVTSLEERWRIEFDEKGVVRSVSHVDEEEGD